MTKEVVLEYACGYLSFMLILQVGATRADTRSLYSLDGIRLDCRF